jgi:hypothetical protein
MARVIRGRSSLRIVPVTPAAVPIVYDPVIKLITTVSADSASASAVGSRLRDAVVALAAIVIDDSGALMPL